MIVIGLTGSIAMGKSTAASFFLNLGIPVFDADKQARKLSAPGGSAYARIAAAFPDSVVRGELDRKRLGRLVFDDAEALGRLEGILHPLIARARDQFLRSCRHRQKPMAVLDIPLLFERHLEPLCDVVVVVTAEPETQRSRALARNGMDADTYERILASQMADAEKRKRADYLLWTDGPKFVTFRQIARIVRRMKHKARLGRIGRRARWSMTG